MSKSTAVCSLRRQIGQKSKGLRSDSSRWLEPCMTQFNHWQCLRPNTCPISWVSVWKDTFDNDTEKRDLKSSFNCTIQSMKIWSESVWRLQNLAGSKQQGASNRRWVIAIKQRIVALLWAKWFLQFPCVSSAVEVVIVPGEAKNTHSCRVDNQLWYRWRNYVISPPCGGAAVLQHGLQIMK